MIPATASCKPAAAPRPVRCAVYVRKSTSAGLDRDFTSLDAQRADCERYILRHAEEGWEVVPDIYEDGGFSGGNMKRPGLQRLLAHIDQGRVDIVVVYKVDRLSRSLLDFAQMMVRFERTGTKFVAVTQNFSTADALGRLCLNMLLTFAEFEREMIRERTRDKIAAARRRGKWTGGVVPLGYDVRDHKLVVNAAEAKTVRQVFALYLQHCSALKAAEMLNREKLPKKPATGHPGRGSTRPWNKNNVLSILGNPIYVGKIRHTEIMTEPRHSNNPAPIGKLRLFLDFRN